MNVSVRIQNGLRVQPAFFAGVKYDHSSAWSILRCRADLLITFATKLVENKYSGEKLEKLLLKPLANG